MIKNDYDNEPLSFDLFEYVSYKSKNEEFKLLKKPQLNKKVLEWQTLNFEGKTSKTKKAQADNLFLEILTYCFHFWKIQSYISNATYKGNRNYLQEEDYFQEYVFVLMSTMSTYTDVVGNFENYFISSLYNRFMEKVKCSFLYITGNIPADERLQHKVINIDKFANNLGKHTDMNLKEMNKHFFKCLHEILSDEEFSYISYKYFENSDKKISDRECAKHFGMEKERDFYETRRKIFKKIRKSVPELLEDYYYDEGEYIFDNLSENLDFNNEII